MELLKLPRLRGASSLSPEVKTIEGDFGEEGGAGGTGTTANGVETTTGGTESATGLSSLFVLCFTELPLNLDCSANYSIFSNTLNCP